MSLQTSLNVEARSAVGKGPNRRLRASGMVPGIFYSSKGDNIPVQVPSLPLTKAYEKLGSTQVFNLVVTGDGEEKTVPSLIWKLHHHPFKNQVMHVDFFGVDLEKEIKLVVPLVFEGVSNAVKNEGGVLTVYRDHLEIVCLPLSIPENIVVDVSELELGKNLLVEEIALPEGVKAMYDENYAVVGVNIPAAIEEESEEEGEEGAEEQEAAEEGEAS
ncbi:MAG: 50S ribosomal protein L25 [Desulfovibrio sp.]|nr:MAG: 50S ribosomal protein L25 [Desulfovibrio sp.]